MSDRTLGIIGTVLISFGFGAVLGEYRGHAEMKRWQDTYYSAHPVQEVPIESNCPTVLVGLVGVFTGECWIPFDDQVNFWKNATKQQKQQKQSKRRLPIDDSFKRINDNFDAMDKSLAHINQMIEEDDRSLDRIGAAFGLCWDKEVERWFHCSVPAEPR